MLGHDNFNQIMDSFIHRNRLFDETNKTNRLQRNGSVFYQLHGIVSTSWLSQVMFRGSSRSVAVTCSDVRS